MKTIKAFTLTLCIVAMGMATSCSKDEEKGNASIVGKWKCLYAVVNDYDYRLEGSKMKIDTNACDSIKESMFGKKWEFTQDGYSQREGEQKVLYSIYGNKLIFRRPGDTLNIPGTWTILEVRDDYMKLNFLYDRRARNGVGNYLNEAYIYSRISAK